MGKPEKDRDCVRCGMPLKFATTEKGKNMPVSLASHSKRLVLEGDPPTCKVVDTYLSHYADCPAASSFRRS